MSFVHSALFWGGIGLVSIPIIIHLITRRRFRRLDWAAMEFLLEAMRRNRRRIRLEQLILLLCRVALVALIVLAVARPHLSRDEFGWMSGPFRSEEKVFVLDDSLSTAHVEAGRRSLDRGIEAMLASIERVSAGGARDPVTVIRCSSASSPIVAAAAVDATRLGDLRRTFGGGSFRPTAVRMDLAAVLEDLATSSREERGRVVHVLTDLCSADWTDDEGEADAAITRALERLAGTTEAPTNTRVVVVDIGPSSRDNLAVTDLAVETRNPTAGVPVDLRIELTNFGKVSQRGVGLRLRTEDSLTPAARVAEIASGETVQVRVPHTFPEPGIRWVEAEIDGSLDGLAADDVRRLAVQVVSEVDVLVVDGEPSGVFGEGESDFLAHALRPRGEVRSEFAPTIAVETNLPTDDLERFGAVFLANVPSIPGEFAAALASYVREGGGLVIFTGDQVDANVYARALGPGTPEQPGPDVLAAAIGDPIGDPARPVSVDPDLTHPFFARAAGGSDESFRLIDVERFTALEPLPDARVAARLTDADRSPLVVERQVGRGQSLLVAVPADVEWSNWPTNLTYLPVLHETLRVVARRIGSELNRIAGTPIEVRVDLAEYQREARLRGPDFPASPERRLLASPVAPDTAADTAATGETTGDGDENGGDAGATGTPGERATTDSEFVLRLDDTRTSGVYTLVLKTVSGEEETRRLAVNPDPAESDLTRIPPDRLAALYAQSGLTVVRDPAAALSDDRGRFEIADAILIAFLLLLFVEGTLAWLFAHHHRRSGADAGTQGASTGAPGGLPRGGAR